jgi:hypothetical protein
MTFDTRNELTTALDCFMGMRGTKNNNGRYKRPDGTCGPVVKYSFRTDGGVLSLVFAIDREWKATAAWLIRNGAVAVPTDYWKVFAKWCEEAEIRELTPTELQASERTPIAQSDISSVLSKHVADRKYGFSLEMTCEVSDLFELWVDEKAVKSSGQLAAAAESFAAKFRELCRLAEANVESLVDDWLTWNKLP